MKGKGIKMIIAKNQHGKLIKILDSTPQDTYTCPVCNEILERKYGIQKQYFAHPKNKGDDCEIKMKLILKDNEYNFDFSELEILTNEYYNKTFKDIRVELSDYKSEEGYYLTQEQKEIIFAKEDRIKISALAGSSKTMTLYYYAKENPFKKILYVVYNKAMKDEATITFGRLGNVDIKTIHGLAFGYVGSYYKHKLTQSYNAVDVIKDLNLDWNRDQETAVNVYEMIKEYMLSNAQDFDELDMFNQSEYHAKERDRYIALSRRLWEMKKDYNSKVKVEHDFYLKLFQLSRKDLSYKYDTILIDEVQDASKLVLDILINSNVKGICMVGDRFQKIYSWRKAIDIQPLFEAKEYKLTTSFRVSQNIANICNLLVFDIDNTQIGMKGFNTKQKIVDKINKNNPYVCLCRTNSYIFAETIEAIRQGKKALYYEGGYSSYNFNNILDAYYFWMGHETKNSLFNKFKNYTQMEKYVEKTGDLELKALIRMIDNYGSEIPTLINSIKNNTTNDKTKADVIFSTIHRSKGMTYTIPVLISDDHYDIDLLFRKKFIERTDYNNDDRDLFEEMAIIYVAITRCAGEIELSETLKKYLLTRYDYYKTIEE